MSPEHLAEYQALMRQLADFSLRARFAFVALVTEDGERVLAATNVPRQRAVALASDWTRSVTHAVTEETVRVGEGTKS